MTPPFGRLLIHLAPDRFRVIDLADVYYLEAEGELALVQTRSARRLRDVRRMGPSCRANPAPHHLTGRTGKGVRGPSGR